MVKHGVCFFHSIQSQFWRRIRRRRRKVETEKYESDLGGMEMQLENCFDPVLVAPPSRRTKHPLHSLTHSLHCTWIP